MSAVGGFRGYLEATKKGIPYTIAELRALVPGDKAVILEHDEEYIITLTVRDNDADSLSFNGGYSFDYATEFVNDCSNPTQDERWGIVKPKEVAHKKEKAVGGFATYEDAVANGTPYKLAELAELTKKEKVVVIDYQEKLLRLCSVQSNKDDEIVFTQGYYFSYGADYNEFDTDSTHRTGEGEYGIVRPKA